LGRSGFEGTVRVGISVGHGGKFRVDEEEITSCWREDSQYRGPFGFAIIRLRPELFFRWLKGERAGTNRPGKGAVRLLQRNASTRLMA
jgi:hypothetical protein